MGGGRSVLIHSTQQRSFIHAYTQSPPNVSPHAGMTKGKLSLE